jgi:hypothetical protein
MRHPLSVYICAVLLALPGDGPAETGSDRAPKGLWLLPRKDAANSARADVPGNMRLAPKEIWRFGGDAGSVEFAAPVTVRGREACLIQSRSALRLQQPNGQTLWCNRKLGVASVTEVGDLDDNGTAEALVTLGARGFALVDLANGEVRWRWMVPEGASLGAYQVLHAAEGARLIVFPQNTIKGFCLDLKRSSVQPVVLWERTYPNTYWQGFGPLIVLADMDNDGQSDIVLAGKPGYAAVLDAATGRIKFDLHYEVAGGDLAGRPYGLLQAADLDGDGFRDVVMISCQEEEYAVVLHNERGKGLRLLWSQFVEHDLPDDFRELRPNVTSLADLNGDGRRELMVGAFNLTGDNRWHTLVLDAAKGLKAPLADLPDRYFWGCYDLNGDGRPEIITSTEKVRKFAASTTLQAVDGRSFRDVASVEGASLFLANGRLPQDTGFMAIRHTPLFLKGSKSEAGIVLDSAAGKTNHMLWRIRDGKSVLSPLGATPLALAMAVSARAERIEKRWGRFKQMPKEGGPAASAPLLSMADGKRELVMALADGTTIGGEPDLSRPGKFKQSWTVPGGNPAIWVGPQRERVVCTLDGGVVHLTQPTAGRKSGRGLPQSTTLREVPGDGGRASVLDCANPLALSDGRDNFLVGLPNGELVAVDERNGAGVVLWKVAFDAGARETILADVDGDGLLEIVVETVDGRIRVLKGPGTE